MAGLNHKGPEEKGPKTGRGQGLCSKNKQNNSELGVGLGLMRRQGCNKGQGKRLNVDNQIMKDE